MPRFRIKWYIYIYIYFFVNSKNQTALNVHLLLDPTTRQIVIFEWWVFSLQVLSRLRDSLQVCTKTDSVRYSFWALLMWREHSRAESLAWWRMTMDGFNTASACHVFLIFFFFIVDSYYYRSKVLLALCGKDKNKDFCASAWPIRVTTSDNRST